MLDTSKPPTLLDTAAAAQVLGLQPRTLEHWRSKRRGPAFIRLSATRVRYALDDLESWLQARTDTPYPPEYEPATDDRTPDR